MISLRIALLLLSISACSAQVVEPSNAGARDRWESSGIDSYQFHYKLNCFCFGPAVQGVTIVVKNGQVVQVILDETDAPADDIESFETIDTLFDQIDKFDKDEVYSYSATYDPDLGYPVFFAVDVDAMMADEEWGFAVSNFSIIEPQ